MVSHLLSGGRDGGIPGGWEPLGKLMFYCPGCHASNHFIAKTIPGHFVWKTKFSKTSGKQFLVPQCQADILYISKICEHLDNGDDDDLGLYRGIFRAFGTSKTRRMLLERGAKLEENELCPFCCDKVWVILCSPFANHKMCSTLQFLSQMHVAKSKPAFEAQFDVLRKNLLP
jgi:hypothetical protein